MGVNFHIFQICWRGVCCFLSALLRHFFKSGCNYLIIRCNYFYLGGMLRIE